MDHGHMGHDHGHMDHGDMGDMPMCSMNMLFTWSTQNLCIVFPQWRVTGPVSLFFSLIGVVLLTAGYELIRDVARRYEAYEAGVLGTGNTPIIDNEASSLLNTERPSHVSEQKSKTIKAGLYAVQVFYSFFIMLLFMTYNGWIMLAVGVGAFVGYMAFGSNTPAAKTVACH